MTGDSARFMVYWIVLQHEILTFGQVLGAATTAAAARLPAVAGVGAAAVALVAAACRFGVGVNAVAARCGALGAGPLAAAGLLSSATTAMTSNMIITDAAVADTATELLLQNYSFSFRGRMFARSFSAAACCMGVSDL